MKISRKKNPMRLILLIGLATLSTLAFQNCGQFNTQDLEAMTTESASTTPPTSDQPEEPSTPTPDVPAPNPPPPPAQPPQNPLPPDYNSDILAKVGLKLGPRGNSTCQLQPPTIPAFDQASDGTNVFKVCQSSQCPYQTISAALTAAPAGSVIAVKAGTYNECVRITKNNITLQGRGGRPIIQASDCPVAPWSKAIIGVVADNVKIENVELTDPTQDSVIGIGMAKSKGNITVHNVYIHHAQGGVLTVLAGDIVITNSYFDHLGHIEGTDLHTKSSISAALDSQSALIRNVTITHPKQQSRVIMADTHKNTLDCIVVADLDGGVSRNLLAFQYGYEATATNMVLQRGPLSVQQMMLYWERSSADVPDQFTAKNNIFISDVPTRTSKMLVYMAENVPTTVSGNTFIGPNSAKYSSDFMGNQIFESRAAAGLAADVLPYPGSTLTPP